jgi:hypothetical protein
LPTIVLIPLQRCAQEGGYSLHASIPDREQRAVQQKEQKNTGETGEKTPLSGSRERVFEPMIGFQLIFHGIL